MQENQPNLNSNFSIFSFSKYAIILGAIIGISVIIRLYYFPFEVPLNFDALYYFVYSLDIYQIGKLPSDWSPTNNGWPIFVSIFFFIFDSKDVFTLMQIQKLLSVSISVLLTIPVYFLCKKFVARKFAIIGASLIAFDPRLMINSFSGGNDPLYLLLITTGLTLFLFSNKKIVYFSFLLVSLATLTRGEGIFFLIGLFILFFIKYRKEKYKVFFSYIIILAIILLVMMPITSYRIDVNGNDPIFTRSVDSVNDVLAEVTTSENANSRIFEGGENFVQFLIWVMIPNFIIFLPLGIFLMFQSRNFNKNTIIISTGMMMIPAFYAYTFPAHPALDTRYLYTLFPMFSVLAVLSIERIVGKLDKSNIIIIIIILAVIVSSILFYDYKKVDYEHEKESFEIMTKVFMMTNGTNYLYPESSYVGINQIIKLWPYQHEKSTDYHVIYSDNFSSLKDLIIDSKDKNLTHIIVDGKKERSSFLVDVFNNEGDYPYLEKIYDSKNNGFFYHVKVFKINYEKFNLFYSN